MRPTGRGVREGGVDDGVERHQVRLKRTDQTEKGEGKREG